MFRSERIFRDNLDASCTLIHLPFEIEFRNYASRRLPRFSTRIGGSQNFENVRPSIKDRLDILLIKLTLVHRLCRDTWLIYRYFEPRIDNN